MKSLTELLENGYGYDSWIQNPSFTYGTILSDLDQKRNMALIMMLDMPWLDDETQKIYLRNIMEGSYEKVKEKYEEHTKFGQWCIMHGYDFPFKEHQDYIDALKKYKDASHKDTVRMFISVAMSGRDQADVLKDLNRAINYINSHMKELDYDSYYDEIVFEADAFKKPKLDTEPRLECLGEDIKVLGECNACFFCKGWESSHGCNVERAVCEQYNIRIIDEPEE